MLLRSWVRVACDAVSGVELKVTCTKIQELPTAQSSILGDIWYGEEEHCITSVYMHIVRILETKSVLYDPLKTSMIFSTFVIMREQYSSSHFAPFC